MKFMLALSLVVTRLGVLRRESCSDLLDSCDGPCVWGVSGDTDALHMVHNKACQAVWVNSSDVLDRALRYA